MIGIEPGSSLASAATRDLIERGGLEAWKAGAAEYRQWFSRVAHKPGSHMRSAAGGLDWWFDGLPRALDLERRARPPSVACDAYPLTLAQAISHPERAFLTWADVAVGDLLLAGLAARWLRLLGFAQQPMTAAQGRAADIDFFGDLSLVMALAGSAPDFRVWWARDDASGYEMTMATGSEDWAVDVLARVPNEWPHALPD